MSLENPIKTITCFKLNNGIMIKKHFLNELLSVGYLRNK